MKNQSLDTEDIFSDAVDDFTVLFYSDRIFIGEHEYPVGQCMVDILNLEESELLRLDQSLLDVYHAIQSVWRKTHWNPWSEHRKNYRKFGFWCPHFRSIET